MRGSVKPSFAEYDIDDLVNKCNRLLYPNVPSNISPIETIEKTLLLLFLKQQRFPSDLEEQIRQAVYDWYVFRSFKQKHKNK
jgi:hypothetical protein